MGKVESGTARVGQQIKIMPSGVKSKIVAILIGGGGGNGDEGGEISVASARCGENVKLKLSGVEVQDLNKGFVICSVEKPCREVKRIKAMVSIVDMPEKRSLFTAGYQAMLHCHTASEEATVVRLLAEFNKKTNERSKRRPAFVKAGGIVECILEVEQTICAEAYSDMQVI
jgi:peptide chain release factor subunit 3